MKPLKIKGVRTRLGYTQQYMAEQLDISVDTYRKKERGSIKFANDEKAAVAKLLVTTVIISERRAIKNGSWSHKSGR